MHLLYKILLIMFKMSKNYRIFYIDIRTFCLSTKNAVEKNIFFVLCKKYKRMSHIKSLAGFGLAWDIISMTRKIT